MQENEDNGTRARLALIYDWMREPDHTENASVEWLLEWVNRRPIAELTMVAMTVPPDSVGGR